MSARCTSKVKHSLVKVEENKRKVIFRNSSRHNFDVTKIDGCLVISGIRTDYLVSKDATSVLVELKGTDVEHACEQLLASAKRPEVKPLLKETVGFLVICSRYPRFDSFVAKAKTKCAREYKSGFHVICDKRELDIEKAAAIDGPY